MHPRLLKPHSGASQKPWVQYRGLTNQNKGFLQTLFGFNTGALLIRIEVLGQILRLVASGLGLGLQGLRSIFVRAQGLSVSSPGQRLGVAGPFQTMLRPKLAQGPAPESEVKCPKSAAQITKSPCTYTVQVNWVWG